jgi:sulfite exporter TauE/SafE
MYLWKFLHVVTMFAAVGLSVGTEVLLQRLAQTEDVPTIRNAFALAKPIGRAAPFVFLVGLIFGLIAAAAGQFNFFAPWLIVSYVIFAIAMGLGGAIIGPWQQRVGRAAAMNSGAAPSAELKQLLHNKRAEYAMWINFAAIVLIVFVMVLKPFG